MQATESGILRGRQTAELRESRSRQWFLEEHAYKRDGRRKG